MSLAALGGGTAFADDPNPWYIGASEALTHDSNVNRLGDNQPAVVSNGKTYPRGDTYSSTSLVGGFDQSYARQHVYGTANLTYNKYNDNSYLDNTSYGLNAGWDWASIWNLSGGFYVGANQSLAQLNGNTSVYTVSSTPAKNEVRSEQFGTTLKWGGPGALSVVGAFTHSKVEYTNEASSGSDSSGNTASLGLNYQVGPTLTTGIAYRVTSTDQFSLVPAPATAPAGTPPSAVPYTTDGRNIDLLVNYQPTVLTGINARLSFTHQDNSGYGGQGFSGLTGGLTGTWQATGKVMLTADYQRDAGTNGTFFNVPLTGSTTTTGTTTTTALFAQNSTVTNTVAIGAKYAATAKIGVNAGYSYRSATISSPGVSGYKDNLQDASLGATWAVGRVWSLGCNLLHETRNVHTSPVFTYSANVIGCSAQATLR